MTHHGASRTFMKAAITLVVLLTMFVGMPAGFASSATSASFSGGAGTVTVDGTLYAKNGGVLTLTVNTSSDTKCVDVTGAHTGHQTSATAKSAWTFSFAAGLGDGVQSITASASPSFNANNCTGQSQSPQGASYILDNTGPVLTATLNPVANGSGWNKSNVSITWSATDAGSGVVSGPTPATDSQNSNTPVAGVTKTSTATDRLGNGGNGSVTVKLDKTAPTIGGSRAPAANANGWNNSDVTVSFTCSDGLSGIQSCTPSQTLTAEGANQSVTGNATDTADNSAGATVSGVSIDKTAPSLSGAPTTSANADGWYNTNVSVHWTCTDALSGFATSACPSDQTISTEGTGQARNANVSDKAGNSASATSSPSVSIDKTAPVTTATAPTDWNNTNVTVSLNASDGLSGVKSTNFILDGGSQQTGTSLTISTEGTHSLQYWSVDKAGNTESHHTIQVLIDKTPPTINHSLNPLPNANGWNNANVTVTFACGDQGGSGIKSCGPNQTVTTDGANQTVAGTAVDNADNIATDPATVSVDKTPPTITATPDRAANSNGWYDSDVTVSFACADSLSGIDTCTGPKTLGEGAGQSASGTAKDNAGNSTSASATGLNVDETAPTLTGAATSAPNGNGWYDGDVTIAWSCSDSLSGLDGSCPPDGTIVGEGSNLSASASVSDRAGNSTSKTVSGIEIDRTAPSTSASVPPALDSGWYAGPVSVTLSGNDGLSGVDVTYYQVDGGASQTYGGAFDFSTKGLHTITFWSVDNAGNTEDNTPDSNTITLKIDGVPPTITPNVIGTQNGNGWYNAPVTVTFSCSDAESGVAGCDGPVVLGSDGANQSATGTALDNAGNSNSVTVNGISIDQTPPVTSASYAGPATSGLYTEPVTITLTAGPDLSGINSTYYSVDGGAAQTYGAPFSFSTNGIHSIAYWSTDNADNTESQHSIQIKMDTDLPTISGSAAPGPNANGWNNSDVSVHFTCADSTSGLKTCTPDSTLTDEAANQSVVGSAEDIAGNTNQATVHASVDKTAPSLSGAPTADANQFDWYRNDVTIHWDYSDALSGIDPATKPTDTTITGEGSNLSADASVSDLAGNSSSDTVDGINIDRHSPTIGASTNVQANANGWYNQDVVVSFACADSLSGVAACDGGTTLSSEGSGQSVNGTATDKAGNLATTSIDANIDKTPPTLTGAPTTPDNGAGWYKGDVTIHWTASDALSGIDLSTLPSNSLINGEGSNLSAGASVKDLAGNSTSTTVSGIRIDRTAPGITAQAINDNGSPRSPNAAGWYTSSVRIRFTCSDVLSGVATCPADVVLSGNGIGKSATGTAFDVAGNSASASVSGIKIDDAPPQTSANNVCNSANGWCKGTTATVTITALDQPGLSGVKEIRYSVDGGSEHVVPGASASVDVTLDGSGNADIAYWAVDNADNVEQANGVNVKWDNIAPSVTHTQTPSPNGLGWNNSNVTIHFTAKDDDKGSGVDPSTITPDQIISAEGLNQAVHGQAYDYAENLGTDDLTVSLDKTPPTINGSATTSPNANGWYNGAVTVHFTCSDPLSGLASCSADKELTSDGASQSVIGTAKDNADNSATYTVSGVNIDTQAPLISAGRSPAANLHGWNKGPVTVTFNCTDSLSGVATCPSPATLASEGAGQLVTGTAKDKADNPASASISGVNIDLTKPTIAASTVNADLTPRHANGNGWFDSSVPVHFDCADTLSEVDSCPSDVLVSANGSTTVSGTVYDLAGNSASTSLTVKVDSETPSISPNRTPAANINGWNNSSVTVSFTCSDGVSGVDTCSGSTMLSNEGAGQSVSGTVKDNAGNTAGASASGINIDLTAPTITGAPTTSPNGVGWYTGPVTVHFTCSDALSGIDTCPPDVVLSTDGANQSVSRSAKDNAGNTKSTTVGGLNIDVTGPSITLNGVSNGGTYTLGAVPAASCTATDATSGNATCSVIVTGGMANGAGTFAYTATAKDKAGNTSTMSGTYRVIYRWDGFLQPINDTAHQVDQGTSIFKAGSTVPVKFQLRKADGTVVQAISLPLWLVPAKGNATTASVDESSYSDPPTAGGMYRLDGGGQQYIYNWGTAKNQVGYYWRVGVTLDDGQTYYVNIGLR